MALTYPVDTTKTFVAYSKSQQIIVKKGFSWPRLDGGPIENLDPDIALGYLVQLPEPAYNPLTQKLVPTETVDKPNTQLILGWNVVALTQEELDYIAEQQADAATKALIEAGIEKLKNPTGTNLERIVLLEKAMVYVLKQAIGIK